MVHLYAEHVIEDYDRWETHHEANADARAAHGSCGTQVFRKRADPTTLLVIQELEDGRLEEALTYFESVEFQAVLDDAGVVEITDAGILDRVHEQNV